LPQGVDDPCLGVIFYSFFTEEIRLHDVILCLLRSNLPTPGLAGLQIFSQQELFRNSV
jgi:hypothetical protein